MSTRTKKSATKKSIKKPVASKERYVTPEKGTIRFKLLAFLRKHKAANIAVAKAVAAGFNKHTASKQIYRMAANGAK
jgi:hypothetical protein